MDRSRTGFSLSLASCSILSEGSELVLRMHSIGTRGPDSARTASSSSKGVSIKSSPAFWMNFKFQLMAAILFFSGTNKIEQKFLVQRPPSRSEAAGGHDPKIGNPTSKAKVGSTNNKTKKRRRDDREADRAFR